MTVDPQKITFAEIRAFDVHEVLIYCRDHKRSRLVEVGADRWPDHMRPSDIEPGFHLNRLRQAPRGSAA